jgi:hypothetical protein
VQDGIESDIDCGGCCRPCTDGRRCRSASDCLDAACVAGRCAQATCPACAIAFTPSIQAAFGLKADGFVAGDFDGDGRSDLVVSSPSPTPGVFVFHGNGDGTFTERASYTGLPGFGEGGAAADLDGDGRLDLAFSDSTLGAATLMRGRGDGTFQSPIGYGCGTRLIEVGDVDGDGHLDLITGDMAGGVGIIYGPLPAAMPRTTSYNAGVGPGGPPADFDCDGRADFPGFTFGPGVGVELQPSAGMFIAGPMLVLGGKLGTLLVVGDFDRDGHRDVALLAHILVTPSVAVLLGDGAGDFALPRFYGDIPEDCTSGGLIVLDLNGDGILDLAASSSSHGQSCSPSSDNAVVILAGRGDGTFGSPGAFPVGGRPDQLAATDFDGDGRPDLATLNTQDGSVSILINASH